MLAIWDRRAVVGNLSSHQSISFLTGLLDLNQLLHAEVYGPNMVPHFFFFFASGLWPLIQCLVFMPQQQRQHLILWLSSHFVMQMRWVRHEMNKIANLQGQPLGSTTISTSNQYTFFSLFLKFLLHRTVATQYLFHCNRKIKQNHLGRQKLVRNNMWRRPLWQPFSQEETWLSAAISSHKAGAHAWKISGSAESLMTRHFRPSRRRGTQESASGSHCDSHMQKPMTSMLMSSHIPRTVGARAVHNCLHKFLCKRAQMTARPAGRTKALGQKWGSFEGSGRDNQFFQFSKTWHYEL